MGIKIGFVVNDVATEEAAYTSTRLAMTAVNKGHESYTLGVGDFVYAPDGTIFAHARSVNGKRKKKYDSLPKYLEDLQGEEANEERICIDELDVLLLRSDPAQDAVQRPWAQMTGFLFGELATTRDVIVLNDPGSLAKAISKTYFQHFPEDVRPKTCISRHADEIKQFIKEQGDKVVIKPLQGSGGQNVFVVGEDERANLNQMIEAVVRDGYCIAQEYLPAAADGDVRLFVMNGRALEHNGQYAAFRRVNNSGDARSNMHSGGESKPAKITEEMLALVEAIRPKLVRDGMYLVGLDIVGDKLIEINVFSPGGLGSAAAHTDVDFAAAVIDDLERKVECRRHYGSRLSNVEIATL